MNLKQVFYLILTVVICASCTSGKAVTGSSTAKNTLAVKDIIVSHKKSEPTFNTLAARVQLVYTDENREQSITASLRMEKDKTIWIKASFLGVTLAKVLITPTRVSYYESISKSYFEGDFALLSDFLGTEIDFEKAQAILLGQSIFNLNANTYNGDVSNNKYRLLPKRQNTNFITGLFLYPENFKVASETIAQPDKDRLLSVRYSAYELLEGSFYPSEIKIEATEAEDKTNVEINYKKIDLNVSINFPFTIPDGYTEISL